MRKIKKELLYAITIFIVIISTGCSVSAEESALSAVQNGVLDFDDAVTVKNALEFYPYFTVTDWSYFVTEDGREIVQFDAIFDSYEHYSYGFNQNGSLCGYERMHLRNLEWYATIYDGYISGDIDYFEDITSEIVYQKNRISRKNGIDTSSQLFYELNNASIFGFDFVKDDEFPQYLKDSKGTVYEEMFNLINNDDRENFILAIYEFMREYFYVVDASQSYATYTCQFAISQDKKSFNVVYSNITEKLVFRLAQNNTLFIERIDSDLQFLERIYIDDLIQF